VARILGEAAKDFIVASKKKDDAYRWAHVSDMRFKSKDEVNVGTHVLFRMGPSRWNKEDDAYYAVTGSDHMRVGSFWDVPPGRTVSSFGVREVPKEDSTHVEIVGVAGFMLSWDDFFKKCVRPDLYYPNRKMTRMAYEVPPDQRY